MKVLALGMLTFGSCAASARETSLFWGDSHVHTSWSVDAYSVMNHFAGPDEAFRYARGIPVPHTRLKTKVRIKRPLDFMVVADHAENYRRQVNILDGIPQLRNHAGYAQALEFMRGTRTMGPMEGVDPDFVATLASKDVLSYGWTLAVDIAERNHVPGTFTTFAGWDWTRNPGGNQHRNIFTGAGPQQTKQFSPFSTHDDPNPEDLWSFLDATSQQLGMDFV